MRSEESIKRRLDRLLGEVKRRGFNTVVLINEYIDQDPANFIYVSGSWGYNEEHSALIFDVNGGSTVVMPHWGAAAMEERGIYDHVIPVKQEKGHHIRGIREAITRFHQPNKICLDLSTMSAQYAFQLTEALNTELSPSSDISDYVFKLRSIKDNYEIEEMTKAVRITEEAVAELAYAARPGADSRDLKKTIDASMIRRGAVGFSFDGTVSFARGKPRPPGAVKSGDMLALDVGCRVPSAYCSDMGRNIPIAPDAEVKSFLNTAVLAHVESMRKIGPNTLASDVLDHSNKVNVEYGFDPMLRCGHQIGLECHDYTMPYAPNFGQIDEDRQPLKEGMTLTYEPPHTVAKRNLRTHFEDIVLITEGGFRRLNELPWDFLW